MAHPDPSDGSPDPIHGSGIAAPPPVGPATPADARADTRADAAAPTQPAPAGPDDPLADDDLLAAMTQDLVAFSAACW